MTFLGIGPGELFVILIILLVVVGPERLPGFARQLGKGIVSLRNWVQRSPDAQLFLRARDELENELRAIRDDLSQEMESVRQEMITVREEMIQATREATIDVSRQLDDAAIAANDAVQSANQQLGESLQTANSSAADILAEPSIAPPQLLGLNSAEATPTPAAFVDLNGAPITVPRSTKPNTPANGTVPQPADSHDVADLRQQLAGVSGELHALREQIRQIQRDMQVIPAIQPNDPSVTQPNEALQ